MTDNDRDEDDGKIYRIDTVPPPAGEGDAYNAPTKVGPMAKSVIDEMLRQAETKASEHNAKAEDAAPKSKPYPSFPSATPKTTTTPPSEAAPTSARAAEAPAPAAAPEAIPQVYDEDDDDDHAATLLNPRAKPPPISAPRPTDSALLGLDNNEAPRLEPPQLHAVAPPQANNTRVAMIALAVLAVALVLYVLLRPHS